MQPKQSGFVLVDILAALFIVSLGLTVLLGLANNAVASQSKAANYFEAVNIAASEMDQVFSTLKTDPEQRFFYITADHDQRSGIYTIHTKLALQAANLARITVQVSWQEQKEARSYKLESLCYFE